MKKLLCLFSATLIALTSCSNNDDNDSSKASSILPKQRINIKSDGSSHLTTYLYDGNKIESITEKDGIVLIYTYTGNVITKVEEIDDKGKLNLTTEYNYVDGKLVTEVEKNTDATYYYKTKYTYNADGTVSYDQFRGVVSTNVEEEYGATGKYTFKNGNLVKLEVSYYGSDRSYVYEYDSKNNPFKNVLGLDLLFEEVNVNNLVKETGTSGSGTNSSTNTITYTYKYDANNYPTESVMSYQSGTSISTKTTQYVY